MSVQQDELIWRKSATGASDGGAASGTVVTSGLKNDLWPNISDANRIAGGTRYKKVFVCNDSVTDALVLPSLWVFQQPTNIAQMIGLGFDDANDGDPAQGNMTEWSGADVVALQSSAADARVVSVYGLSALAVPQAEDVTLDGTTEVTTVGTYSVVYGCHPDATGAQTLNIKEGVGGTVRGVIGPSKAACWLWLEAVSKAGGISLPSLPALTNYGLWLKQTWAPGAGGVRPDADILAIEEN
jgi:hypothetical protein